MRAGQCRVAATCRGLGIRTVAVYSEADAQAAHVAACDEAVCVGPAEAAQSYLRGDRILQARPRSEDLGDAHLLDDRYVVVRDGAAGDHQDIVAPDLAQFLDDRGEEGEVRAGEDAQADNVHVLLQRRRDNHLRRLADAGVNDLHPRVAQCPYNHFRAAIVTIEARLGDENAYSLLLGHTFLRSGR